MRSRQRRPKRINTVHVPGGRDFSIRRRLSHRHRAIMTTQAQAAGDPQRRLGISLLVKCRAVIGRVPAFGQLLVPERRVRAQPAMRCVAERAPQASLRVHL